MNTKASTKALLLFVHRHVISPATFSKLYRGLQQGAPDPLRAQNHSLHFGWYLYIYFHCHSPFFIFLFWRLLCLVKDKPPPSRQTGGSCSGPVGIWTSISLAQFGLSGLMMQTGTWTRWRCPGCEHGTACWEISVRPGLWSGPRSCSVWGNPGTARERDGRCCAAGTTGCPTNTTDRQIRSRGFWEEIRMLYTFNERCSNISAIVMNS